MSEKKSDAINLWELEARARELLPQMGYDYYASGANDEITLRENRTAYERIMLLPRMLVDVSVRDMSTTVLGEPVSMPILIAPTALQGLAHPEGEIATRKPWRWLPGPSGSSFTCLEIQLDTTPATISILPEIVDSVAGAGEVYVDGGDPAWDRRAQSDGLWRAGGIGRAPDTLWGLTVGGETGVTSVLEIPRQEFDLAMALSGCPRLTAITRDIVRPF
jgi:isopentenyl diphosphate isomerase/L-lactate dehydrogenase-like FMN-dependent dehydrogenase